MTTTPTASPELLDLDKLEALARAATAGPWLHRRDPGNPIGAQHCVKLAGENGAWVCDCIDNADRSTVGGIAGERNAAFIASAHPAAVLALIQLARRAQPEGEAPQAAAWQPIETAPKTGQTLLLGRLNEMGNWRTMRGQWFTKAEIDQDWEETDGFEAGWYETAVEPDFPNCWQIAPTHWMTMPAAPAATLSPLCGAQHVESGKEVAELPPLPSPYGTIPVYADDAEGNQTHEVDGWTADQMRGYAIDYSIELGRAALAAQQAAASGALEKSARALAEKWHKDAVDTGFATSEAAVELLEVLDAAPSAPGTPEAPTGYAIVPIEPTERMIYEGGIGRRDQMVDAADVWRQMLRAAQLANTPKAPVDLPRLYRFDCYVGKTKMAAGVGVHASTMEEAEQKARKLIDKEETIKFESNDPCHATRKCNICATYKRAAQLDGGQGEGK